MQTTFIHAVAIEPNLLIMAVRPPTDVGVTSGSLPGRIGDPGGWLSSSAVVLMSHVLLMGDIQLNVY